MSKGAPVVFESNPTYLNLFGRIENKIVYGMAMTDFSMIRGGSVHRANGGYLIVDALDMLRNAFSYEALKRAIKNKEIKIEDVLEQYRLISTATLKPEAIPLETKVIIVGTPNIYYLLYNLDPEYSELFKVKADFDSRMERTPENVKKYAHFIADCQKAEKLLPFDRSGVARLVEFGSQAGRPSGEAFDAASAAISDLMKEAHYWAKKDSSHFVRGEHVTGRSTRACTGSTGSRSGSGKRPWRTRSSSTPRREGGAGERPRRARPRGLQLRQALAHHGHAPTWARQA